jgi:glycosyltransferase involved in cell wall biosynthesis
MHPATERTPGLLVLDAAYSLEAVRRRGVEHSILCRDLRGYFAHVWSVNPLVGADPDEPSAPYGRPRSTAMAPNHTFVEGFVGLTPRLDRLAPLNFVAAQAALTGRLLRLVRSGRVSAIRAGDPYYLGLLGLLLSRVGRVPLVVRINGNYDAVHARTGKPAFPRLFRSRRVEKVVERFVLRRADFVTAGNQNNLDFAVANGADVSRTAVFPYGNLVDPAHFESPGGRGSRPAGVPDGPFVAAVTRLEPVKRVDDVLRAYAQARPARPGLHLVLIGDGSLRAEVANLAESLGVADGLVLAGERPQPWIADALPHASLILAASAGRALVEATLSGRPVVAYDDDWHGELVHDGVTGRLVPVGDVAAMAAAMRDLLTDAAVADRLGAAGRVAAMELMDPALLDTREQAVYEGLRR